MYPQLHCFEFLNVVSVSFKKLVGKSFEDSMYDTERGRERIQSEDDEEPFIVQ